MRVALEVLLNMHHIRKRKSHSDDACTQYETEGNEGTSSETRDMAGPANKTDEKEESIFISDSDSLELEEEGISQKTKTLHRKTLAAKRKIARMTEEEQLALAVKISQQEQANQVKHRQEEDELLRKAIEESLHVCESPDKSAVVTVKDLTEEASSGEEGIALDEEHKEHLSQQSQILKSSQDSPQNPKVLLKRLSQDIVESPSVILSPNCKDPLLCTESRKAPFLSQRNSNDFAYLSPSKASLSPVIPVKSPYALKRIPCRLFQDKCPNAIKLAEDVDGHCSESTQLDSSSSISTSNKSELKEGASSSHNVEIALKGSSLGNASMNYRDKSNTKHNCQSSSHKIAKNQQNNNSVHYYWGIPFCPNGEDPDAYAQVILCQLEVYEKSLKKSQRQLLQKTKYGKPIDLVAASSDSNEHTKDNKGNLSQEDTEEFLEGGDHQKIQKSEMELAEETDSLDIQPAPSKRSKASCSQFQEDDQCCLSEGQVKTQSHEPCTNMLPSECEGVAPEVLVESPILPPDMRDENCSNSELPIGNTQEESDCPETQLSPEIQDNDQENQPDLTEAPPLSPLACCLNAPPDLMACGDANSSLDVECPMCGCRFSQNQIERHAAYCDGVKDEPQTAVLRPRNRQSRHAHNGLCEAASSDSGKLEKCYVCKSLVLIKDYQTHVDKCLQSATLETSGTQRLKSSKLCPHFSGRKQQNEKADS
ncbi:BRCA1-A complex subunit RAP80 [Mantella aurantiaca]